MSAEQYSLTEKLEIVSELGIELRLSEITEEQFRRGIARLGFNATDIDQFLTEALKTT